jgi:hypothetical protein
MAGVTQPGPFMLVALSCGVHLSEAQHLLEALQVHHSGAQTIGNGCTNVLLAAAFRGPSAAGIAASPPQ